MTRIPRTKKELEAAAKKYSMSPETYQKNIKFIMFSEELRRQLQKNKAAFRRANPALDDGELKWFWDITQVLVEAPEGLNSTKTIIAAVKVLWETAEELKMTIPKRSKS